jgi:hypothetical protein
MFPDKKQERNLNKICLSRKVILSSNRTIRKPVIGHFKWCTGKLTSKILRKKKVKFIIKRVGRLPANASPFHG